MNIEFATCNRKSALEYLQRVNPSIEITDTEHCAKPLLDLVEKDFLRVQDPTMYGNRIEVIQGKNCPKDDESMDSIHKVCNEFVERISKLQKEVDSQKSPKHEFEIIKENCSYPEAIEHVLSGGIAHVICPSVSEDDLYIFKKTKKNGVTEIVQVRSVDSIVEYDDPIDFIHWNDYFFSNSWSLLKLQP